MVFFQRHLYAQAKGIPDTNKTCRWMICRDVYTQCSGEGVVFGMERLSKCPGWSAVCSVDAHEWYNNEWHLYTPEAVCA